MSIEMKLQCFIGIIDTHLFETIHGEILETKDIQNRDAIIDVIVHTNDLIDTRDKPSE